MSKSKSNKPAAAPSKKKGTPPTKPLTKAKKAAGAKRRPAFNLTIKEGLSRAAKSARKVARSKSRQLTLEKYILKALDDGKPRLVSDIWLFVRRCCLDDRKACPSDVEVRDTLKRMFKAGKIARAGNDRYLIPFPGEKNPCGEPPATGPNAAPERPSTLTAASKKARHIQRERPTTDEKKESAREAAAAMRLRIMLTPEKVSQALVPVADSLGDLLAWPGKMRDEDMLSVDMIEPSHLEGFFDRIFDEPPVYRIKFLLIRPLSSGSISEHPLLACEGTTPLEAGQRFLAEAMMFVRLLLNRARGERNTKSARERLDQNKRLKRAYDQFMRDYATARATLPGSVLDKAAGFF